MWFTKALRLILHGPDTYEQWLTIEKLCWAALFFAVLAVFFFFGFYSAFSWFYCGLAVSIYWWLSSVFWPDDDDPEYQEPDLPGNELPSALARQFLIIS